MLKQISLVLDEPVAVVRVIEKVRIRKRSSSHNVEDRWLRTVRQVELTTLPFTVLGVVRFVPTHTPKERVNWKLPGRLGN